MTQFLEDVQGDPSPGGPAPLGRNFLLVLWQRKALVVLGVVVGVGVATLFAARRAPVYQSSAQVLVVKKRAETAIGMAGPDIRPGFFEDYVSTNLALISSEVVIEAAVEKGHLESLPSFAGQGNPSGTIIGALSASRDAQASNIISLSYRGPVREDCPAVINAVIASYKDFLAEAYHNVSEESLKVILEDRERFFKELNAKQEAYLKFREGAPVSPGQNKDGAPAAHLRLGELQGKLLSLAIRSAEIDERMKVVAQAKQEGKAREVVQRLRATSLEKASPEASPDQQLLRLEFQKKALLRRVGEDHPLVQKVQDEIDLAREFQSGGRGMAPLTAGGDPVEDYLEGLRLELANISLTRAALDPLEKGAEKEAHDLDASATRDKNFIDEIARTQQRYDQTAARIEAINRVRDIGGYDARTITKPGPGGRIGTGLTQTLLAGAAMGLLLGVALAYLADLADKSFRSPEEVRRRLGLPIVGHVPLMDEGGAANPAASPLDPSLASFHRPSSAEAEAYRSVRTAVFFSTAGETHKVIQITSPNMADGKTTLAANLAIAMAQSGKRVVLVDADMRRPRVQQLFGLPPEGAGLSSVITGAAGLEAALHPGGLDNLTLLPCGPRPANPAELLTLARFDEILQELRGRFDFVLLDTPPLLAVTDPCVVASRADGVLLTIRIGKHGRPAAERAREVLLALGANIVGVVVNGVSHGGGYGAGAGYRGYRYGYEYGYGGGYKAEAAVANGAAAGSSHNGQPPRRSRRGGWLARWWGG